MADEDINTLYERALAESGEESSGDDRRSNTRIKADATSLSVRAELQVAAIDVSVSGLAFFSSFPMQVGQPVHITVGTIFTVEAEVVRCNLEHADEEFLETHYKVQCRFYEEEQGKYLLVMIKQMDEGKSEE